MDGKGKVQALQEEHNPQSSQAKHTDSAKGSDCTQKTSMRDGVLTLIRGTASQIIVQLRLTSEFGIPHFQIFSEDFRGLSRGEIEQLLVSWLRNGNDGLAKLDQLHSDLLAHQIAVISGLDGIVKTTLEKIAPAENRSKAGALSSKKKDFTVYSKVYQDLNDNIMKRHQQVVIPGFVSSYVKSRDIQTHDPITIEDSDV